jgi:hypothetical protein
VGQAKNYQVVNKTALFFHDAKEALIVKKIRHAPQLVLMISQP